MGEGNTAFGAGMLPSKVAWAVWWFCAVGAAGVVYHVLFVGAVAVGEKSAARTVLPFAQTEDHGAAWVRDAEVVARTFDNVTPYQRLEWRSPDALARFVVDLQALATGTRTEPVRVLHYGDSILAPDTVTGYVREVLQRRFGNGGPGFLLPLRPWKWYHHQGLRFGGTADRWRIRPITEAGRVGRFGLGGVTFVARRGNRAKAWVAIKPGRPGSSPVQTIGVSYLEQPGGGHFSVVVDGQVRDRVSTLGPRPQERLFQVQVPLGMPAIRLETEGDGVVQVFGWVLETGQPGVVYDNLAVSGARATVFKRFEPGHWAAVLRQRHPSLIVVMLGANEGAQKVLNLDQYASDFSDALRFLRRVTDASCLVVGALDQARRDASHRLVSKTMPKKLSEVQRQVAFDVGCAFFDTQAAMARQGGMPKWSVSGLGGADLVHPTKKGAMLIGQWLAEALLDAFRRVSAAQEGR